MRSLVWKLSALMEYHEELVDVVTLVELWGDCQHSWSTMSSLVWKLSALMEYHEELVDVVTLVELWGVSTLMEYHVRYLVDGTISTRSSVD